MEKKSVATPKKAHSNLPVYIIAAALLLFAAVFALISLGTEENVPAETLESKADGPAAVLREHALPAADANYFYIDHILRGSSQAQQYPAPDPSLPLDGQYYDRGNSITWAEHYAREALEEAARIYALADAARKEGFAASGAVQAEVEQWMRSVKAQSDREGFETPRQYLRSIYGGKADTESYEAYLTLLFTVRDYCAYKEDGFTYDDAALRAYEAENYHRFSSFTFHRVYVGTATRSEEKALQLARKLTQSEAADASQLNKAIEKLDASLDPCVTEQEVPYEELPEAVRQWLCFEGRTEGDMTIYADTAGADGVTLGYCVIMFRSRGENTRPLVNLHHIFAATASEAEQLMALYQAGEHTQESFIALGTSVEHGCDVLTDVYPGQLTQELDAWCFHEYRLIGDVEILQTQRGFHIVYFAGLSQLTYRDHLITQALRARDYAAWREEVLDGAAITELDLSQLRTDYVIQP